MKVQMDKAISLAVTFMLLGSFLLITVPQVKAQATAVRIIPSNPMLTYSGETVTLALVVEDVTDLAGFGMKIKWNTTYLDYVSHTLTVPVEDYPAPNPPSTYAGIIHAPELIVADTVDTGAGTYDAAASTLGGPSFNGSGTAFVITLVAPYIPFKFEVGGADYIDLPIEFLVDDLADSEAKPIDHTTTTSEIRLITREFEYPPWPKLKVMPETIEASAIGEINNADVYLMGKNMTSGALTNLDPFWDVAGVDAYLNFDPTMLRALSVTVDPDGWFGAFWLSGIYIVAADIDNVAGTVHVAFLGYGDPHTPPFGQGRVFTVEFESLTESATFPPDSSQLYLENPQVTVGEYTFDSIGGLFPISSPLGTEWTEITPFFGEGPFELISWDDDDGSGDLSAADHVIVNDTTTGFYFKYRLDQVTGTLNLTQQPFQTVQDYLWATDAITEDGLANWGLPGRTTVPVSTAAFGGFGKPYWTGTFSLDYPFDSINSITANFVANGSSRVLVPGVDYIANPATDTINLLVPLDVPIINEHWVDGVNNSLNGWPFINYVATGIQSVFVDMHNNTQRFGRNLGFEKPPPAEWWYEPDWPGEVEGWWALGYFPGPWNWPAGSEWWVNYTAVSYLTVDFNADPDPNPRYLEFDGSYSNFTVALTDPNGTLWDERYPRSWRDYEVVNWTDSDSSTTVNPSDYLEFFEYDIGETREYHVEGISVDILAQRKQWIVMDDPSLPFFGVEPIVAIAGYPHPERDISPWLNKDYAVPLPHAVNDATYIEPFKPLGGFIDIYTQYPPPYGGQGKDEPSDMFWPQKEVIVHAKVTYADWPEQYKDVAFEVKDPLGNVWGVFYNRTDANGMTLVRIRLPWPCENFSETFGEWTIFATVDVACVVVNDTLTFKHDYKVNIWDVTTDKDEYAHSEDITITIDYGSYAMQDYNITLTVTVVDASGVPFGFDYIVVTIGGAVYCQYKNDTAELTVHVAKFARPPIGTIYVGALSDFPQNGGSAETPVFEIQISILAEWA